MTARSALLISVVGLCLLGCVGLRDRALKPGDDHLKAGFEQLEKKDLDAAERSFQAALDAYDLVVSTPRDSVAYGWCYYGLGTVALNRRNTARALEHYKTAIGRFEAAPSLGESDGYAGFGWTLVRAGLIYRDQRAFEQARPSLERALDNLHKTAQRDHNAFFLAHHAIGHVLLNLKDFDGAVRNLLAAEAEYKDTSPINPPALAEVYYNLATAYVQKRGYEDAKRYFLQARGVLEQSQATDKKTLADIDYYVGAIYLELEDMSQADKHLRLALVNYGQAIALRRDKGDVEAVRQMEEQVSRIKGVLGN